MVYIKPGQAFLSDKKVWLVLSKGIYSGYYRCMSADSEIAQYNGSYIKTSLIAKHNHGGVN